MVGKRTVLRVTRPCSLAWEQLSGRGDARDCSICQTTVHDLDSLTTPQIHRLLAASPNGFCGRYTALPGQPFLVPEIEGPRQSRPHASTAALALLATAITACGHEPPSDRAAAKTAAHPMPARSAHLGTRAAETPAPAVAASSTPASLSRETCERLSSLGYISIDCSKLPSSDQD